MMFIPGENTIFLDLDGVLVNFDGGTHEYMGYHLNHPDFESLSYSQRNALINKHINHIAFWANLKPMDDFSTLWGFVKPFKPEILSAYPSGWSKDSDEIASKGKLAWCRKWLQIPENRIHIVARPQKQDYAINKRTREPNVLIDDRPKNIREFEAAGGIAIYHTSAVSTITQLKLLMKQQQRV
jgi:hypothetical protein